MSPEGSNSQECSLRQIGYARRLTGSAARLSYHPPTPLDVTDWGWAAGGGDDRRWATSSIARSLARTSLRISHVRMLPLEAAGRSLQASAG
jgi:hypothetical protein